MGLWAEAIYLYTFFNFGYRIGGCPLPRPGRFIPKEETRYPFFWTLNGPLGPSGVPLIFLNFGTRVGGWSMSRTRILPQERDPVPILLYVQRPSAPKRCTSILLFNFGTRISWWSMPRPGPLSSNKENRYPLYWTLNGPLVRNVVPQLFLILGQY